MSVHSEAYDSFEAFVKRAREALPSTSRMRTSRSRSDLNWAGGTFESVSELARTGWMEGAKRIEQIAAPILETISSRIHKPQIVNDIEGDTIDMGAYLTGDPESFLRWEETEQEAPQHGKVVRIGVNVSTSAYFSTEQYFTKGAAVAVLVDALEASGRRVILDVICSQKSRDNMSTTEISVRAKNAEDPVNRETLAFVCAHAGMLRRLVFSVNECMPAEYVREVGYYEYGSYGQPVEWSDQSEFDIYIGSSNSGLINDPAKWAMDQLKGQGVLFEK